MFEASDAVRLLGDWGWLERSQIMPLPGGLLDQDPRWVEGMELITGEIERLKGSEDGRRERIS